MIPQTAFDQPINSSYCWQNQCHMVARLGSGGMSEIMLGVERKERGFERFVVVKKYTTHMSDEPQALAMFTDEARIIAALNHPHIVKIIDFGQDNDQVCMLMEYVDGETLRYVSTHLKRQQKQMPLPIVLELIAQACAALAYLHEEKNSRGQRLNLIHRDIDLQNLMIDRHGYLKIIDFGIAKSTLQSELTSPGLLKGKLPYLCPDVFYHRDIDARVDVYALGLALFELSTQRKPFDLQTNLSINEVVTRIVTTELAAPSELVPGLPVELDELILKATKKNRKERFQNANELFEAIQSLVAKTVGMTSPHEVKAWFEDEFKERIANRREFERRVLKIAEDAFERGLIIPPSSSMVGQTNAPLAINALPDLQSTMSFTSTNAYRAQTPNPSDDKGSVSIKRTHLYALLILSLLIVVLGSATFWLISSAMQKRGENRLSFQLADLSQQVASMNDRRKQEAIIVPPQAPLESPAPIPVLAGMSLPSIAATPPLDQTMPKSRENASPIDEYISTPDKLLSGTGSWNGAQVIKRGCATCHKKKFDWSSKTRGQWRYFFLSKRHSRHADLERYFTAKELKTAQQHILRNSQPALETDTSGTNEPKPAALLK